VPYDGGCGHLGAAGAPKITPELIAYHRARAHTLRAQAFAAAGRWLVQAVARLVTGGLNRVIHG
jgi:hypothetical protein